MPRPLLALAAALTLGGAIGAVSQFVLFKDLWVWEMPDLAHRFLAAAAGAYVVGGAIVLLRRRRRDAELLAATVLIYGYPLVAAILLDADVVDWSKPIAWTFVVVVTPAVIVGTIYLLRERTAPEPTRDGPARGLLAALALGAGILGVLVYAAPRDVGDLWPWGALDAWKIADHRLIASMLLTVAGGALLALLRGSARLLLAMVVAYCAAAAAGLALHAADTPALQGEDTVYIAVLAVVGLLSLALSARASAS
ncbi:MAG: hypothetical protein QOI73_388 [Solirubrobacteraceae bacterium]|nr:hypothetical protein [Solirubrobacteraceae bacterium]